MIAIALKFIGWFLKNWRVTVPITVAVVIFSVISFLSWRVDELKADKLALEYKVGQLKHDAAAVAEFNAAAEKIRKTHQTIREEIRNAPKSDDALNGIILRRTLDRLRR